MKFLLDENISGHTKKFLEKAGHDILFAPKAAKDREIMQMAQKEHAVILTRDRDFLTFLPTPVSGVIFVQIHPSIAEKITQAVSSLLKQNTSQTFQGKIIILKESGYEIFS